MEWSGSVLCVCRGGKGLLIKGSGLEGQCAVYVGKELTGDAVGWGHCAVCM